MKRQWKLHLLYSFAVFWIMILAVIPVSASEASENTVLDNLRDTFNRLTSGEPAEIQKLREQELITEEEGYLEYYFSLLT